ncbi:hypothetical protein CHLNCDRAFT_57434 [Chlorella variabilis]|uniref:DNA 3'-5' helicase n=1 Tax=Chlorella variabilis TaxID=554065 RepID=E1ZAN0_CHLVA|nr:hypothetical protein CHLNCDRAFT_57434 [Chlorella variabilis]EFN57091.1 hypothetical protein CHLNCDRAFT_57434 [Chlorella variabilis]|eukprot:XP_005849193.1 hypothetical protein CHLNCDRAFT_57434 [Chlorella variabilis]
MSGQGAGGGMKIRLKVVAGSGAGQAAGSGGGEGSRRRRRQEEDDEDYHPGAEGDPDVVIISDEEAEEGEEDEAYVAGEDDEEDDDFEVYDSEEKEEAAAGGAPGSKAGGSRPARKPTRGRGAPGSKAGQRVVLDAPARGARKARAAGGRGRGGQRKKAAAAPAASRRRPRPAELAEDADLEEEFVSDEDYEGEEGGGTYRLGAADEEYRDFTSLRLKPDHFNRRAGAGLGGGGDRGGPLWVCPDCRVFLETFSPVYKQAYDFLIAIAEPVSRPEFIHEYQLTPHSLYAAVSIGLEMGTIVGVLGRLSKNVLPREIREFIQGCTQNYGKVKLVLQHNRFFVESPHPEVLRALLADPVIRDAAKLPSKAAAGGAAVAAGAAGAGEAEFRVGAARRDRAVADLAQMEEIDLAAAEDAEDEEAQRQAAGGQGAQAAAAGEQAPHRPSYLLDAVEDPDRELHSFEVEAAKHRPYQEKSLSKMFGNGRARSGIIVLPCGAGKSLVGVSAAARIKKGCLCLCTNGVSVDQWKYQFEMWTNVPKDQVCRFTSQTREWFEGPTGVCITTYTMVAFTGRRSTEGERIMSQIMSREWGLLLLDEVHVVPAAMFRKVLGIVKAHCKLGLTATLVREDSLIGDLNFLIGPKLYEANWLDLTRGGHIASVQCAEKKARAGRAGAGEEFDAFFYTLVTLDTQEVYFSAKRQQFLIDQGYSYKVIPHLLEAAGAEGPDGGGLLLSSHEEQLDVLAAILAVTDADLAEEETDDKDDIANLGKKSATRRVVGDMAALSGAAGMRYMEYSTGAGGGQGGRARPPGGGKLAKMAKKYG